MGEVAAAFNAGSRRLHAQLSDLQGDLFDFVSERPACWRFDSFPELAPTVDMPYRIQPWPTLIDARKLDRWQKQSVDLVRLIKDLPRRVFGMAPAELDSFYGLGGELLAALVVAEPNGFAAAPARLDLMETPDGLRCIEANIGSYLDGWFYWRLAERYLSLAALAPFVATCRSRLLAIDTTRALFGHVIEDLSSSGFVPSIGELTIAICATQGTPEEDVAFAALPMSRRAAAAVADDLGLKAPVEVIGVYESDFEFREGRVFAQGRRLHAVLELQDAITDKRLFRCFKAGQVVLYSGPGTAILSDKRNLALLSELADSDLFDPSERDLIQRLVPWTRCVDPGPVEFRGGHLELDDLLISRQRELVLKRARSSGGQDVFLGSGQTEEAWREIVATALRERTWVVQERLTIQPYLYQAGDQGVALHDVVWGLFVFGDAPGGGYLRMMPGTDRPVNVLNGAAISPLLVVDAAETACAQRAGAAS